MGADILLSFNELLNCTEVVNFETCSLVLDFNNDVKYFEGMFNCKKNMLAAVKHLEQLTPALGELRTLLKAYILIVRWPLPIS